MNPRVLKSVPVTIGFTVMAGFIVPVVVAQTLFAISAICKWKQNGPTRKGR